VKSVIAEDLVKTYRNGAVRALDHLSLDVEEGTVLSVLGPNGAGKTTCVRILATLLKPDSGRAMVGGIDVIKHPEKVREVIGFVKGVAKEVAPDGITINCLAPAVISTPMNANTSDETLKYMISRIPMGRVGQPEEVAEIVAFMASKACSFTTGFTFDASGGRATY
jgi:ABC-type cobalamin/Fe3+-siderophores transport system ATPase subunit